MLQGNRRRNCLDFLLVILLLPHISSTSISFSYRTCLPNIDLLHVEHSHQSLNSQSFRLVTRNFRLHLIYTSSTDQIEFQFGNLNLTLPSSASFDYQFKAAIDYYHEIDTWHYVNITFDDSLSKVFLSFNGDETRLIPLIDYSWKNATEQLNVKVLLDEQQNNVTCLLPHSGFEMPPSECSLNIKTCEHRTCTSTSSAEEYCPLFKIFDCRPFTDLECGLKTIPVRCLNNHCQNRGVCYVDLLRNITLCVCPSGFAGDQCQYPINECQSNPCPKHSHCIDLPNSYTCVCDPGWTGSDCSEDIDECQTIHPCKAARNCINLPGTYKCDCFENFGGQNCEMTLDPCLSQPCLNDAIKCHPILESDNVVFRCTCRPGFTGSRCETNINDCEGVTCPSNLTHCVDRISSFDCECLPTFKKDRDGRCVEQNPCDSSPCYGNATCYNLKHGQYRCMCPSTYTGSRCESDIDECTVFPSICRNGGKCINEIGSYRCYCAPGWTGPTCVKAIDFCLSQPCNRNGTCINQINGFECRCLSSYTGEVCQYDIDECVINPCRNNGTCFNYVGGFHCQCPAGYFGHQCEYSPVECQRMHQASLAINCPDPTLCLVNDTEKLRQLNQLSLNTCKTERDRVLDTYFTCVNEQAADPCSCPSNIIPCSSNQSHALDRSTSPCPCRNGGTCFWSNATNYRCYCPPGLTGPDCLTDIDLCASRPCYHNGTCLSQLNSFTCQCSATYRSTYCEEHLNPCATNPCLNNGICQRENDQYKCQCSSDLFTGKHCEIQLTPCMSQPCQNRGKCSDSNQTFECQCSFQYRGIYCEEFIDLCQTTMNSSLCLNGGLCQISNHSMQCSCLAGFTGLFCETNIDDCYTKPCSPNGECLDLVNGYQCQCKSGWYGYNCDRQQKDLAKSLINPSRTATVFHLRNSSINISKSLPDRHGVLPIRIQYEFRTTLKQVSLLAIGDRFQQELVHRRLVTNLDNKVMLSTFLDHQDDWISIVVEVFQLWIDVRIGKNAMSQRFYVPSPSLLQSINQNIVFGFRNYSGCVRQIEVSYSPAYSILLTDQLVEINEHRMLGCERTNACQHAVCRQNELCHDHWFYHTCRCQSPFFGEQCDQIAPILQFNQNSSLDVTVIDQPITNISFFFNTLQSNGTLFELTFSPKARRSARDTNSSNTSSPRIIGRLVNGRFRLIVIDQDSPFQEYELRDEHRLNDGRPHRIELDLDRNRLIIDGIYNESLTKLHHKLRPNQIEFLSDQSIDGWLQDVRINNQPIPLNNGNRSNKELKVKTSNIHRLENNPCYPANPCLNRGLCLVTHAHRYVCQCESNWFGTNCSQINLCHYNNSSLCPTGFRCQTTGDQQECLAIGTFQGNSSHLRGTFNASSIDKEVSFRFRAHAQSAHLFTIKNTVNNNAFSLYLSDNNLIYRDSSLNTDLIVYSNNDTAQNWKSFHLQWTNQSTLVINHAESHNVNLSFEEIFVDSQLMEISIGNGFRGCLEDVLLGTNLYVPFYNETLVDNDTRMNRIQIEQFDDVQINNCTFNNVCNEIRCVHGQCLDDFDRGRCSCDRGWEGSSCEVNIDECQLSNNCSKEHSICQDQLDGYYTCQCHPGFTGKYCDTNIDDCSPLPCANGGLCTDLINGYLCNCTKDYISANCSIAMNETCLGRFNRCQHNGTCLLKSAHLYVDHPQTECQCRDGYNGSLCQNDLCLTLNCRHNGACQRLPNGQAKCVCTEQWQGKACEDDVDECMSNPCLNNGTCLNNDGGYSCRCGEFYLGQHCERKHTCLEYTPCLNNGLCRAQDEHYYCECSTNFTGFSCELPTCESIPCQNNGTCTPDSKQGFLCNCTDTGYEDERCTTEINECLSKPCHNNATCIDQIGGYTCSCPRSFFGNHCENKKFLAVLGFSYHYVIWPGVAVLLLLVIILLSIVIGRIRESRRSRGTYRPALNENGQSSRVEFSMILKPPPEERLI